MPSSPSQSLTVKVDGESRALRWRTLADGRVEVELGLEAGDEGATKTRIFEAQRIAEGRWLLRDGQAQVLVDVEGRFPKAVATVGSRDGEPRTVNVELVRPTSSAALGRANVAETGPLTLRAMMPGRVVKVLVEVGQAVRAGQPLLVVEAMKMQNDLVCPRDAKVLALHCTEGAAVEAQQDLVSLG